MISLKQISQIAIMVIKMQFTVPATVDRNALIIETIMFALVVMAFVFGYVNEYLVLSFCYLGVILTARIPEYKTYLDTKRIIGAMALSMFVTAVVCIVCAVYPTVLLVLTLIGMPRYTCKMIAWVKGHAQENTNVLTGR